jgi:polysaccharide pyruvyl transferase WcaK-like protein
LIREQADGTVPALNWLARMRVPFGLRRRTALVGVSVGELFTPSVVEAVALQLRRFSLLAARDTESADALSELTGHPAAVMGDLALEASGPVPLLEAGGVPRIAVTTREIVGRGPSVADGAGARLEAELAAALDQVATATGARVELIPLRPHVGSRRRDDDERAGESLAARATTGETWIRREPPRNAEAFARLMATVDLVVSVRLHGAVLAAGSGRPVVGIAYDPKVSGFFRDLGVPHQGLPLDSDARSIGDVILASLEDASLAERITTGVAALRERTRALDAALRVLASGGGPAAES